MRGLYGRGRRRAAAAQRDPHGNAGGQSGARSVRRAYAEGRDERRAARLGYQRAQHVLLHRHGGRSASLSDDGARLPIHYRHRDARADAGDRGPPAGFAGRLHRRRLQRDGPVSSLPRRSLGGNLRCRSGGAWPDTAPRRIDRRRPSRRPARQPHLSLDGRGRPDPGRAFDFGGAGLSRHRPGAFLAARNRPGQLSLRDRRGSARSVSIADAAGRHSSGIGAGARDRQGGGARAQTSAGSPDGRQSFRPRRQGHSADHGNSEGQEEVTTRIDARFAELAKQGRSALVTYVMAGDPDPKTSLDIIKALPKAGADMIEIGMAFTDPMADGPSIQAAGLRALKAGMTLKKTLEIIRDFRKDDNATPVVLMGYYNPIYIYGVEKFLADAKTAGVDGLIVVDLPPEEDDELCLPALRAGLNFIRLATPTTDDKRLPAVLANTSGFVYYVSVTGITGMAAPDAGAVSAAIGRIKRHTKLPIAVGFGVRTAEQARAIAAAADGVVVGSALIEALRQSLDQRGKATSRSVAAVTGLVSSLAQGVREARRVTVD